MPTLSFNLGAARGRDYAVWVWPADEYMNTPATLCVTVAGITLGRPVSDGEDLPVVVQEIERLLGQGHLSLGDEWAVFRTSDGGLP